MTNVINKIVYSLFVLLIFGWSNVFAAEESPQDVVKKYYSADLNGVRLSGKTYKAIKPLIAWEHEPGWDYAFITDDVKIYNTQKISNTEVSVEVRYHIIGILGGDSLSEYDFSEVIDFVLSQDGKKWRIKKPIFPPHISSSSAIKQIEGLIRSEKTEDKNRTANLKNTLERLKNIGKP